MNHVVWMRRLTPLLLLGGCASFTIPLYTPNRDWGEYDYPYYYYGYYYYDDDDGEEDCVGLDTTLQQIDYDCTATGWYYTARTDAWTSDGAIDIQQTGVDPEAAWSEEHSLYSVDYDVNGCWDLLRIDLAQAEDELSQQANISTAFECSAEVQQTLTWMLRVWDTDGIMSDCAVWGHDPSYFSEYGCQEWTE